MNLLNNKRLLSGSILIVATVLFFVINIASTTFFKSWRLDLTSNKIYSLSPGSKEIIGDLKEPFTLRFYFSRKVAKINPYLISYANRIEDMLIQYQRAGKGNINIEIIDPEPFSPAEDNAVNFGLQGAKVDNTGTELYMGLVGTNALNARIVIPFIQPNREANLEYDITQLVYNLAYPQSRVVGVMSALPLQGREDMRAWAVWQQMNQLFDLKSLPITAKEIPSNIKTLMIVEPYAFTKDALKAIDNFVMRGGHLIAFVDPYVEVIDQRTAQLNNKTRDGAADFNELLQAWGIQFDPEQVVTDRTLAKSVRLQSPGQDVTIRYPLWMDYAGNNFDKHDVLSSTMERITMATPGALSQAQGATTTFTPLISTSDDAMVIEKRKIPEYLQNLGAFLDNYKATGSVAVAARVSGMIKSPFTEAKVDESNIIVVADTDMLHDHFWVTMQNVMGQEFATPTASNGNFVLSALDNLSGSNALISIRNRGSFVRPFETLRTLELKSQDKYRESEVALQQKLEQTQRKLQELEGQKGDGNATLLNVQQRQEQEAFRQELVSTRRELREVRRKLNSDIESVEFKVKFYSIGFIPLMIILGGLMMWTLQIRRELSSRRAACSVVRR